MTRVVSFRVLPLLMLLAWAALGSAAEGDERRNPFRTGLTSTTGAAQTADTRTTSTTTATTSTATTTTDADNGEAQPADRELRPAADAASDDAATPTDAAARGGRARPGDPRDPGTRPRAEGKDKSSDEPNDRDRRRPGVDPRLADQPIAPVSPDARWSERQTRQRRLGEALWSRRPGPRPISVDYRLQPGDLIRVVVWGGARVNQLVPIDAAGNLGVPEHGPVPVAGLTQAEAQARVIELARSFFKNAGAVVAVERAESQAVTVVGDVAVPGYQSLPAGGTVLEALAVAGGPTAMGGVRAVRVTRPGQAAETIDLYRLVLEGDATLLTPLPAGSVVFVPPSGPQVQVFGAVMRPAIVEVKPGETLAEALRLAGGVQPFADVESIRVLHEGADGQDLVQVAQAALGELPARHGDRLLIEQRSSLAQGRGTVSVSGAVRSPGAYAFTAGATVAQAVAAAGGLLPGADFSHAIIRRHLAEPRQLEIGGGVTVPVFDDLVPTVQLEDPVQPLDELAIPRAAALDHQLLTVLIQGEVVTPGPQPLVPDMTARDLIRLAGGVTPQAEIEEADLVRNAIDKAGQRTVERARIDLRSVLLGDAGPELVSGDTIVVRRRADERITVDLLGEIRNAGSFTVPSGTTIAEVVKLAGGLTVHAFPEGAALYRESEKQAAIQNLKELSQRLESAVAVNKRQLAEAPLDADRGILQATVANQESELVRIRTAQATGRLAGLHLAEILAGKTQDMPLQRGDVLQIPAHPGTIRILGEVMTPGSLRFERDLRPQTVILRSGGTTRYADEDRVYVVRADGTVIASANGRGTAWSSDERRYVRTSLRSLELSEGDTVIVPPDLRYHPSGLSVTKDITQILFQVAAATGTVAIIAK